MSLRNEYPWLASRFGDIKTRCNNPNFKFYKYYGGRGIRCYFRDVNHFISHCLTLPNCSPEFEIDRIDNDDGYCEGNIRFVTRKENLNNKRSLYDTPNSDEFKEFCKLRLEGWHKYDIERILNLSWQEYLKHESRLQYRAENKGVPLPHNSGPYHKLEEEVKLFARTYNAAPLHTKRGRNGKAKDTRWIREQLGIGWSEYRRLHAKAVARGFI